MTIIILNMSNTSYFKLSNLKDMVMHEQSRYQYLKLSNSHMLKKRLWK
jgi:hypothetical protein